MYLKQVTINGFKSFADKTSILLTSGITCIVGPNGCGKSNIVDAIRWVLGEQSAKALRGGKMQDVIFQGTENRKALGLCEVSLLFSDCEKDLNTSFNEVEITRRATSDGGSDYFINGRHSRLKDVQNLFMDTGVGRISYSLMVQGQIDQILSSNPEERRAVFEEAAGITKYKTQRRDALNKLTLVEQNLARTTDRMEEINRQMVSLRRQASKALRYKKLKFRLKHLDLALTAKMYGDRGSLLKNDETSLKEISSKLSEVSRELSNDEERLAKFRAERARLDSEMEILRRDVDEARFSKERAESGLKLARERKRDLLDRSVRLQEELESLKEQLEILNGRAKGDAKVKQHQSDLVSADDKTFRIQNDELESVNEQLRAAGAELSKTKQDTSDAESSMARLRVDCTSLEVELASYQTRHSALSDSIFQIKEEVANLEAKSSELKAVLESSKKRLAVADADVREVMLKNSELLGQYRSKQAEIRDMDRRLVEKSARLSLLNDFQLSMEGFSNGVKEITKGGISGCLDSKDVKIIVRNVAVAEGWEVAFESLLGPALSAVALADASKLSDILRVLREKNFGRVCFQLPKASFNDTEQFVPEGSTKVSELVESSDPFIDSFVKNLVSGCYFCEDILSFMSQISRRNNFRFIAVAAKDGSMLDSRGIIYTSATEKHDAESSFIVRGREIRRLKSEISSTNETLTALNEDSMAIQSAIDAVESDIKLRETERSELKKEAATMIAQMDGLNVAINDKKSQLDIKSVSIKDMESSRSETREKLNAILKELKSTEKTIADSRASASAKEEEISRLRTLKDKKNAELSEIRLELASKRSRLDSLERGIDAVRQRQAETSAQIRKKELELQSVSEQIAKFENEIVMEGKKAEALVLVLENVQAKMESQRAKVLECNGHISESETNLTKGREMQMKLNSGKSECEIRVARIRSDLDNIAKRVLKEYNTDVAAVDWKLELWKADKHVETEINFGDIEDADAIPEEKVSCETPDPELLVKMDSIDFNVVETELDELRGKLGSMGAVNLVAVEEYTEHKERYNFLKSQIDDLWASKNSLVAGIEEINLTSQKLFSDTFERIKENFSFTFGKIFGGGTADLRLIESEDSLDSGIEIVARPPGTVLKSLSLLSGGQRTMTAVSLLFAIYMVKPSPFCILDELDAPLDDANIGRFIDILNEFTRYSQFLVITHNKRTMGAARTIYGVTMEERGVTRLISMRFGDSNAESSNSVQVSAVQ